jgi:hypothetical protein
VCKQSANTTIKIKSDHLVKNLQNQNALTISLHGGADLFWAYFPAWREFGTFKLTSTKCRSRQLHPIITSLNTIQHSKEMYNSKD